MSLKNLPVVFKEIASFWKTILKMIMAVVLFVTAETVLIVALKQSGFFESHQQLDPVRVVPILVASTSLDDSSLARSLVGTWSGKDTLGEGIVVERHTAYSPDGHFVSSGTVIVNFKGSMTTTGTWHINNGELYYEIETSSAPKIVPVGFSAKTKILKITSGELLYVDPYLNKQSTSIRVK
jgi:hypothetical protein